MDVIILSYLLCFFPFLQTIVAAANWIIGVKLPADEPQKKDSLVSVLFPVRNEASNIIKALETISQQNYQNIEVIVLDDASEDETLALVQDFCRHHQNFRWICGERLPEGWLGKNWACYQLAQHAKGEYFLFLDADIQANPLLLDSLLATLQKQQLDAVSVFPDQIMYTIGEKMVVPIMHYILLTLLPLAFIRWCKNAAFAAANGQCMFLKASVYKKCQPHQAVRNKITEDIEIFKYLKRNGFRTSTYTANGLIYCRMYSNYTEAVHGFSKNIISGFGSEIGLLLFLLLTTLLPLTSLMIYFPVATHLLPCLALIHFLLADMSNQSFRRYWYWISAFFMYGVLWHIGILAIYKKWTGSNVWKGRKI
ncbi:MAG: glycosyltransferase family 2 protein [Cytophagales bacterium]|nr:glycosyltransferase family 2 protein [Cytophagales bacterium]MDW8384661.1 glycosyltransferase family 2 protein [Flammeovirgaceae bacterium]